MVGDDVAMIPVKTKMQLSLIRFICGMLVVSVHSQSQQVDGYMILHSQLLLIFTFN